LALGQRSGSRWSLRAWWSSFARLAVRSCPRRAEARRSNRWPGRNRPGRTDQPWPTGLGDPDRLAGRETGGHSASNDPFWDANRPPAHAFELPEECGRANRAADAGGHVRRSRGRLCETADRRRCCRQREPHSRSAIAVGGPQSALAAAQTLQARSGRSVAWRTRVTRSRHRRPVLLRLSRSSGSLHAPREKPRPQLD
jgi:hypothetical protein